jgi:endonuclease/exonuclease/phosphatase family metal-dependent hydrolase
LKLITWNIQWSRGVDGVVDPRRIVADARRLGDFDVLCLQEVAANFAALPGSAGENQYEIFAQLLPGFTAIPAAAVDVAAPDGSRRVFGNMILSRLPVLRVLRHQLPWPVDPDAISMPRNLLEVSLATSLGTLNVMTTHLEYFSRLQRAQQVEAIREKYTETSRRASLSRTVATNGSPYHALPQSTKTLLVGDFNMAPQDPLYSRIQDEIAADVPRLCDTWHHLNPGKPHAPNVGLYDRTYWEGPSSCNFLFASADLLPHVRSLKVDSKTQSSDHQPQILELA